MDKSYLTPPEIAKTWINLGVKKTNIETTKVLLLGILAGIFIGFGAHADIVVIQTLGKNIDIGFAKFLGAAVFPVGIMLVVMAGAELFTGNNLISLAVMDKTTTTSKMIKNWIIVYIGNFLGSILLVLLLVKSGLYSSEAVSMKAIAIAESKCSLTVSQAIIRGVLCNILVVLACWMQAGSKNIIGKIFALWFPVMLFVLSGFEHSIANMFFIPLGKFLGSNITWSQIWFNNLIPVTIGNVIGGSVIIPVFYWYIYVYQRNNSKVKNFNKIILEND